MRQVQFRYTHQILNFSDVAKTQFEKNYMQKTIRPYSFKFYSDVDNDSSLRSQIKNGKKETKGSYLFFALLMAKDNDELSSLRTFAEKCSTDQDDKDLKNIVFIVFDEVLGQNKYEQFIEYQANYACASSHGFVDQTKVHRDHAVSMVKEWMEAAKRNNATVYINAEKESFKQPISVKHLSSIVNSVISPIIYPYAPDSCEILRQKAPDTFWKAQNSKEIVRTFLFATTKEEISKVNAQMRPIQYLIQNCLDDSLRWKEDVSAEHPFKKVFDTVNNIIKHANKSLPFNFDEKFSILTKPPYGFYGCYATMGMMAFALKPWVNKIFDPQGKPRDANALIDDIVLLFKVWDDNKSNSKLNFKFQTPEEGKLCKELISLFKLNGADSTYKDVTSLKDARYAITADFLAKRNAPLWAIKYAPETAFASLPIVVNITDKIKQLTDNIVKICMERELRNPALVNETLSLIEEQRFEMKNILNVEAAFSEGFKNYLMQLSYVSVKEDEVEPLRKYIEQNLESTVGYWTEEEIEKKALQWRSVQQTVQIQHVPSTVHEPAATTSTGWGSSSSVPSYQVDLTEKRNKAKERIANITDIHVAQALLTKICEKGDEWLLDMINS